MWQEIRISRCIQLESGNVHGVTRDSISVVTTNLVRTNCDKGRVSRTDGSRLNHVADGEALDRLVLGSASRAVGAADRLDVAAAVLVTTAGLLLAFRSPQFCAIDSVCSICRVRNHVCVEFEIFAWSRAKRNKNLFKKDPEKPYLFARFFGILTA